MPSQTALAALVILGAVAYALGRALLARLGAGGAATEKARRLEADERAARAQGQVMAQRRSAQDVADDLDHGRF